MNRGLAWLAWSLWALCVVLEGAALLLLTVVDPSTLPGQLLFLPAVLGFVTVGALIATRRTENAIGWIYCATPLLAVIGLFAEQYFLYAMVVRPGALPAPVLVNWMGRFLGSLGWVSLWTFTLLLFPTGRLPSPRWRPVAWGVGAILAVYTVVNALAPVPMHERMPAVMNPLRIDALAGLYALLDETDWIFLLVILVCAASVLARFRTARGAERQQLKWFAYAAGVVALFFILELTLFEPGLVGLPVLVGDALFSLAALALPVAVGVAILRHRLYDIDLIINRTLVYAVLTGALAAVYLGSVALLQQPFRALTGQGSAPAIVASTLVTAALFNPLRRRIQASIDRRFYRRRYDATLVLAAHRATVRDEVDIDRLTAALLEAADETVRPAHASLWLREPKGGRWHAEGRAPVEE
jgi:hypothetical protein